MTWARRVDGNHQEIVQALRERYINVVDLSQLGKGVPDLLISSPSDMWLAELKTANGKLTPSQVDFLTRWKGKPVIIGRSVDEILKAMK